MADLPDFNERITPKRKARTRTRRAPVARSRAAPSVTPRGEEWYDEEEEEDSNTSSREQASQGDIKQSTPSTSRCGWVKRHKWKVLIGLVILVVAIVLLVIYVPRKDNGGSDGADPSLVGGTNPGTTAPSSSPPPVESTAAPVVVENDQPPADQEEGEAPSSLSSPVEAPAQPPFTFAPAVLSSGVILNPFGEIFGYPPDGVVSCLSSAVSGDGNTVALMSRILPDSPITHVTVYRFNGEWVQLGKEIVGDGDISVTGNGHSLALDQRGNTLVVGFFAAACDLGENCGRAQVYSFQDDDSWLQLGSDVVGEEPNVFLGLSVAISRNGKTIAIGEPFNNGIDGTIHRGRVRVLRFDGSAWESIGTEVAGDEMRDQLGTSVSISGDGTIVACGAPREGTGNPGFVKVVQYEESTDSFAELGSFITGEEWLNQFGAALALSGDGMKIAVSGFTSRGSGMVSVFMFEGVAWIKVDSDIASPAGLDRFGSSVDIDDLGERVVVGASEANNLSGAAYLFRLGRKGWQQRGEKIESSYDAEAQAQLGRSVSVSSSGLVVSAGGGYGVQIYFDSGIACPEDTIKGFQQVGEAITQVDADEKCISSTISGDGRTAAIASRTKDEKIIVRVYVYDDAVGGWTQSGEDIWGNGSIDAVGKSIALSETGEMLVIGLYNESCELGENCGIVRVYSNAGNGWVQVGQDIIGNTVQGFFGWSVAIADDGLTVAAGAPISNGEDGTEHPGKVRVFMLDDNSQWAQAGPDVEGDSEWDHLGSSVALSANGEYLSVGAVQGQPGNHGYVKVHVYDPSTNSYAQVGENIIGDNRTEMFGDSVSLTEDGLTLVVGADTTGVKAEEDARSLGQSFGLVYVFRNENNTWTQSGTALESGRSGDLFGYSVAVDANGTTIVVGAPEDFSNAGSAYVYLLEESEWVQHGDAIFQVEENDSGPSQLGRSVAVSKSGELVSAGSNMGLHVYQLDFSSTPGGGGSSPAAFYPVASPAGFFSPAGLSSPALLSSPAYAYSSPAGFYSPSSFYSSPAGFYGPPSSVGHNAPSPSIASPGDVYAPSPPSEPPTSDPGSKKDDANMPSSPLGVPSSPMIPPFGSPAAFSDQPGGPVGNPAGIQPVMAPIAPSVPSAPTTVPEDPTTSVPANQGDPTSAPVKQDPTPVPAVEIVLTSSPVTDEPSPATFNEPTIVPADEIDPTFAPVTDEPSPAPSDKPTSVPADEIDPTFAPATNEPSPVPSDEPSPVPSDEPSPAPSAEPTSVPPIDVDPTSPPVDKDSSPVAFSSPSYTGATPVAVFSPATSPATAFVPTTNGASPAAGNGSPFFVSPAFSPAGGFSPFAGPTPTVDNGGRKKKKK